MAKGATPTAKTAPSAMPTRAPKKPKAMSPMTMPAPMMPTTSTTRSSAPDCGSQPKRTGRKTAKATSTETVKAALVTLDQ